MAIMGDLSDIPVPDLLFIMSQRRLSGRLLVEIASEEVSIYVRQGAVVMVTSSLPTMRLGSALTRAGLISEDDLQDALTEQENSSPARCLGDILLERGLVDPVSLASCVENQSIDLVARVVGADNGAFLFSRDLPLPATSNLLEIKAERLVLEATRRRDEIDAATAAPRPAFHLVGADDRLRPFSLEDTWPQGAPLIATEDAATVGDANTMRSAATGTDGDHSSHGMTVVTPGMAHPTPAAKATSPASPDDVAPALPIGEHDPEHVSSRLANGILNTRRRRSRRMTRG